MGAQGVETGTRGTLYFDDFESRRFSYIGTLPDPGVDDPTATNPAGWFGRTYQYSAAIPHAVVSVTSEQSAADSYEYDANGNMTCRVENGVTYTHTYNAENRASSIAKRTGDCATGTILESWSFVYDGDGVRVLTAHFTGTSGTPDSTTSYYMGGQFEVKDSAVKKYYSIAGMMVATQDASGLQYLLTDHLGSTVAVTNSSGTLTSQQRYLPFGGTRAIPNSPILGTDFGYTGQRLLDSGMGGIMDYKARFYSPALSRFLQPDTIIPDQFNPQSWNRYSYVTNRPVNFNDPSGQNHLCGVLIPEEDCQDESPAPPPPCALCGVQGGSGPSFGEGYEGPLPEDVVDILVAQGADAEMLDDVVINTNPSDLYWQLSCVGSFNKNVIARTSFNKISWCMLEYFDPEVPTPVLLHELVHVAQYGKYPDDVVKEQNLTFMFAVRDMIVGLFDENWQDYNPYESSWVEVQAANCQVAFDNDNTIPLDRPPCNIWITLP